MSASLLKLLTAGLLVQF